MSLTSVKRFIPSPSGREEPVGPIWHKSDLALRAPSGIRPRFPPEARLGSIGHSGWQTVCGGAPVRPACTDFVRFAPSRRAISLLLSGTLRNSLELPFRCCVHRHYIPSTLTRATTQPMTVHPRRKFRAQIAPKFRLFRPTIEGRKYRAKDKRILTASPPPASALTVCIAPSSASFLVRLNPVWCHERDVRLELSNPLNSWRKG